MSSAWLPPPLLSPVQVQFFSGENRLWFTCIGKRVTCFAARFQFTQRSVHCFTGYDDSVNEAELENEDPFENEALDDEHNFHYDVRDNDVSKSMDEDEDAIEVKAEEHE